MFPRRYFLASVLPAAALFLGVLTGSALAGDLEQDFADPPV